MTLGTGTFPKKSHRSEKGELEHQFLFFNSSLWAPFCVASWWGIGQPLYWSHTQFSGVRIILQVPNLAFKEDQVFSELSWKSKMLPITIW